MMIKLNFIRELLVRVEMCGTANFWKKIDIKEMTASFNYSLILSMAIPSSFYRIVFQHATLKRRRHNRQLDSQTTSRAKYQLTDPRFFLFQLAAKYW